MTICYKKRKKQKNIRLLDLQFEVPPLRHAVLCTSKVFLLEVTDPFHY